MNASQPQCPNGSEGASASILPDRKQHPLLEGTREAIRREIQSLHNQLVQHEPARRSNDADWLEDQRGRRLSKAMQRSLETSHRTPLTHLASAAAPSSNQELSNAGASGVEHARKRRTASCNRGCTGKPGNQEQMEAESLPSFGLAFAMGRARAVALAQLWDCRRDPYTGGPAKPHNEAALRLTEVLREIDSGLRSLAPITCAALLRMGNSLHRRHVLTMRARRSWQNR